MDPKLRIVTQLPLRGLWRETGAIQAFRGRALSSADIRELLRSGPVQFVVVDVGLRPRWIELNDCYRFWMDEVQHHLAEPDVKVENKGVYCYWAVEWHSDDIDTAIVVLELRY